MLYTYTYVKGTQQLNKLFQKMRLDKPRFMESFAHVDDVIVERIYERNLHIDKYYREYFILYRKHEKGTMRMDEIRSLVRKNIQNGEVNIRTL